MNLKDMPREEKLAFFINLYNMMAIHAILVWGHPSGPMERRKLFGEFKYVIGGCTYSLSAIHNGILRSNQRPPYNLIKPFGVKDKRLKVRLCLHGHSYILDSYICRIWEPDIHLGSNLLFFSFRYPFDIQCGPDEKISVYSVIVLPSTIPI